MMKLVLQLFADGAAGNAGAGPAGADGAGAAGNAAAGVKGPSAAGMEFKSRTGRKYSVPTPGAEQTKTAPAQPAQGQKPPEGQTSPAASTKPTFEELIKGDYKDDFGKATSAIVKERLKNSKEAEEKLNKLTPALEALFQKHGLKDGDIEGLVNKITDDDSLYEDEALQKGIPVQTLKEMKKLQGEKANLDKMQAERMQEAQIQKHFQTLVEQSEQVKQMYPGFDLQAELKNPEFFELTRPEVRIPVMKAYQLVHQDEIIGGAMQFTAQKTAEKLSNAMSAGAFRPSENGLSQNSNAPNLTDDPHNWAPDRMRKAMDLVKRGRSPFEA
ncbi:MAG: hypothetical protein WC356_03410 [Candidatus Micrarchaeia archaeon]|jgi:hypothetical protein